MDREMVDIFQSPNRTRRTLVAQQVWDPKSQGNVHKTQSIEKTQYRIIRLSIPTRSIFFDRSIDLDTLYRHTEFGVRGPKGYRAIQHFRFFLFELSESSAVGLCHFFQDLVFSSLRCLRVALRDFNFFRGKTVKLPYLSRISTDPATIFNTTAGRVYQLLLTVSSLRSQPFSSY